MLSKLTMGEWEQAINKMIISHEGGYVDNPSDRGGPTNYGITIPVLSEWIGREADKQMIKDLNLDEAIDIYYELFVEGTGLKPIHPRLALLTLDTVVNHGRNRGVKMLQRAAGVVEDGVCGPKTIAAVDKDPAGVYNALIATRMKAYAAIVSSNTSQIVFLAGWLNRLSKFLTSAY